LLGSVKHRLTRWIDRGLERGRATSRRPRGGRFAPSRPVRSLILAALLLAGAVTISIVILLSELRERTIQASENEIETIAALLAEQTSAEFQALSLVETSVIERINGLGITSSEQYEQQMADFATHLLLKEKIAGLPHVDALILVDGDGKLFNYSRQWPVGPVNIADRTFFNTLKSDPTLSFVVSEPVINRTTGTSTIYLARKVSGPDGAFIGVVQGAMQLDSFEAFYKRIAKNPGDAISMFRSDGLLLTHYPSIEGSIGQTYAKSVLAADLRQGVSRRVGVIDGAERLVAASALPRYPIVVTVSATLDTVLANWRAEARTVAGLGLVLLLMIGGTCVVVVRRVQQQGLLLDAALNNMPYGLTMVSADGRLAVVNGRFLDMYALAADIVVPGSSLKDILIGQAEAGRFSADAAVYVAEIGIAEPCRADTRTFDTPDGRTIAISIHPMPGNAFVAIHDDITVRRRAEDRIAYMAHHDALTDLPNRVALGAHLAAALQRAKATKAGTDAGLAVLCVDLDRFKEVNDVFGHSGGDALLREVSRRFGAATEGAYLARVGGDEFVLISADGPQPRTAAALAQRLQAVVADDLQIEGDRMSIGLSVGVAIFPADGTEASELLINADTALYRAKSEGRDRVQFFAPAMDQELRDRRALLRDLRSAVAERQLILHYQPEARITGEIVGFEALVRWNHPVRGLLPPSDFVPLAETNDLIDAMGEWVLREACRAAAAWRQPLQIAVNLSPVQFRNSRLTELVHEVLAETELPPDRLELEITEGALIDDLARAVSTLHQLKRLGVRIALDDFGTGYSSLSYLRSFPFDKIKIDQSFISDVESNPQSAAIVGAIVGLAKGLGMLVLAEGVETAGQLAFLLLEGCEDVQGNLIGHPFPIAQYAEWTAAADGERSVA